MSGFHARMALELLGLLLLRAGLMALIFSPFALYLLLT